MELDLDLLDLDFGGWCLTLAPIPPDEALRRMGAGPLHTISDALQALHAFDDDGHFRGLEGTFVLAREIHPGTTLALELPEETGGIGPQESILHALSTPERPAVNVYKNPNTAKLLLAEHNGPLAGLEIRSGRRFGPMSAALADALTEAGFSATGYGLAETIAARPTNDLAGLAIAATTGITLSPAHFTGIWYASTVP